MSYILRVLNFAIFSKSHKSQNLVLVKFSENKITFSVLWLFINVLQTNVCIFAMHYMNGACCTYIRELKGATSWFVHLEKIS